MAETHLPTGMPKPELYPALYAQAVSVVRGEGVFVARAASISCLLYQAFHPDVLWAGFYLVAPDQPKMLVVGPYQGTLGCLRIPFGKGVCGAAALGALQLVQDVEAFPGHIACDSRSRSEIVVPVFDSAGEVRAVLDIDSPHLGFFDDTDALWLQKFAALADRDP